MAVSLEGQSNFERLYNSMDIEPTTVQADNPAEVSKQTLALRQQAKDVSGAVIGSGFGVSKAVAPFVAVSTQCPPVAVVGVLVSVAVEPIIKEGIQDIIVDTGISDQAFEVSKKKYDQAIDYSDNYQPALSNRSCIIL